MKKKIDLTDIEFFDWQQDVLAGEYVITFKFKQCYETILEKVKNINIINLLEFTKIKRDDYIVYSVQLYSEFEYSIKLFEQHFNDILLKNTGYYIKFDKSNCNE